MPSYLLTEVLTSGASTTLASIHHVCVWWASFAAESWSLELRGSHGEGFVVRAPSCLRPCSSPPPPTSYSLPLLMVNVCVFACPRQRNLCLHRVLAVRPQIYLENRSQLLAEWSRAEARPIKRKLYSRAKAHNSLQGETGRATPRSQLQSKFRKSNLANLSLLQLE